MSRQPRCRGKIQYFYLSLSYLSFPLVSAPRMSNATCSACFHFSFYVSFVFVSANVTVQLVTRETPSEGLTDLKNIWGDEGIRRTPWEFIAKKTNTQRKTPRLRAMNCEWRRTTTRAQRSNRS